ncbi:MAG: NAD(P)-binding protein [Magnetococcales bacterium]|nr:NAD(P)-binding protein [Magnetococcales bacterium]NGZ04819.1 NAD(P)-binding protein [Magnetococcales bacterium]
MYKPFAITLDVGSSLVNHTGSWRTERPVFVHRLPPCNAACPAGENIQGWLYHAEEGNYHLAWQEIMKENPLPAIMGRCCYHSCERACNRTRLDETVGIHAVERFLGDQAIQHGWSVTKAPPAHCGKVLIVGSGPAGLSAAYHLLRLGHEVEIREAAAKPGGLLRYGIPRYRLPRKVLDAEIDRIIQMGAVLRLSTPVTDLLEVIREGNFQATFVALGAQKSRWVDLPNDGSIPISDAIQMLRSLEDEIAPSRLQGKRVAVYGGGNVAVDAARSAIRLGAAEVTILYRRSREKMPAHSFEVKEAVEEAVQLKCLRTVEGIQQGQLVLEERVLTDGNEPLPTGRREFMAADLLILALGQEVDTDCCLAELPEINLLAGNLQVDATMMTGRDGLYAGGDMVPSERNITVAVGHGKLAARHIDARLRGTTYTPPATAKPATFERLNTWYFADAPSTHQPVLSLIRRQSGFEEVLGDLDESNALFEARRCLSCGNCFECDNCYGACPDNAIAKLGPGRGFAIKYDYCKGCGLCIAECPCGAIEAVPEEI